MRASVDSHLAGRNSTGRERGDGSEAHELQAATAAAGLLLLSLSFSRGGALSIYLARGTNAHSNNNLWEARSKARSEGGRRERDDAAIESRTERRMGCNEGGEASGQVKERY